MSGNEPGPRDLPDLAGDVRERVAIPPYDEVSRRVRARRLRGAAGTLAAAVLVVGGVAVWQNAATTAGPPVPQPAQTDGPIPMTDESLWRAVLNGTDAHPFDVEGSDDGSIAVIWRALEQPEPTFALVIREADGTVHGRRLDVPVSLTPVPSGWVGVQTAQGFFIATDGTWTSLGTPQEARPAHAGDVFIRGQPGNWLYSSQDRTWSTLRSGDFIDDGYVTPAGDLKTCDDAPDVDFDTRPSAGSPGGTCDVAGRGSSMAFAGLGDDPDGSLPLVGLMLKDDEAWSVPDWEATPLDDVVSLVVTPSGHTLVTDTDGDAVVFANHGTTSALLDERLGAALVAGDRLYATSYAQSWGPLLVSDDDGRTWHETPLPGMESSEE